MEGLVRDVLRQRARSGLTVAGVALGIFTLVVFGALGEHFRAMVREGKEYTRGTIRIATKTNAAGFNPGVTEDELARLRARDDVDLVCPCLMLWLDGYDLESNLIGAFTPKPLVLGIQAEHAAKLRWGVSLLEGRWLEAGDRRQAMAADWLVERRGLALNDTMVIRNKEYELVGIYRIADIPLLPSGLVPYEPLNDDFIQPQYRRAESFFEGLITRLPVLGASPVLSDPKARSALARDFVRRQEGLFRMYDLIPKDRSVDGTRSLAAALRRDFPELAVIDPDRVAENMEKASAVFLVITAIVTALSSVVGGLLIINTMAMAVMERRREIAIKAAIGASPGQIITEFLAESALIGLAGAVIGLGLGAAAVWIAEPYLVERLESGGRIFLLTPRLMAFAALYGLGMGLIAGVLPAARAARVDPAVTLREL